MNTLKIKRLDKSVEMPMYAHDDDACFDVCVNETAIIKAGESYCFGTGLAFEIPRGWVMKCHVRSSVGIKRHLILSNGTGIIDAGYRGELHIALTNLGKEEVCVVAGQRMIQCELCKVNHFRIVEADALSETDRGTGGIGSTGL